MKFSICIPNYNYAHYLGRTLQSVLAQEEAELEVVIADNCSTDDSVKVIQGLNDDRVTVKVNQCNVGFAGNLDKAASMASGEMMIMLSSDDLMRPRALSTYQTLFDTLEEQNVAVTSTMDVIDPEDAVTGSIGRRTNVFCDDDLDEELSRVLAVPVYRVKAEEALRRCLEGMTNPFNFAATAYPREAWLKLEGYGGGRMINPDKWFHWRLLGVVEEAIFVDSPLFAYRWHPTNQAAQQAKQGALKYLVDEYASTLEASPELLERAELSREEVVSAFVEHDVAQHGLATLAKGDANKARRILDFGRAVYPAQTRRNPKVKVLAGLLAMGPAGHKMASVAYTTRQALQQRQGRSDAGSGHHA